ncbi:alpha/beta fold hydrolase [Rhizobium sp. C4]|uniref:alpha/beta fold hydrolase n=1 Tax=Rhizobium sp. C4 TaxID=1349800 RepID=UPI001E583FA0|nr:alpha/beta fold hydrolase [Rhizobium sp. C4]MCD2173837.1 alpha/beta fold hydrolase [Rhizobium sp. C4]
MSAIAGDPVRFDRMAGIFTPAVPHTAPSDTAVLLVSPWGFEDMPVRRFYREIAEALAARGIASLRFDLPGTGDSAEVATDIALDGWLSAIADAAREAGRLSGASKILLLGHGLGATLALLAETRVANLTGIALLAPVTSGRIYARETGLWWKMIAADLGLGPDYTENGTLTIAGMTMPETIAASIRKLRDADLKLSRPLAVLAVCRQGRDSDGALADALATDGATVTRLPYDGFDGLVVNPLISKTPAQLVDRIAEWARSVAPAEAPTAAPEAASTLPLAGEGYRESGHRFGEGGRLIGTFCQPEGDTRGAPVLLVSTSYDRASAWANSGAATARDLARRGIASLRFDAAGIADSPAKPGDPAQMLYSKSLDRDVALALDELKAMTGKSAVLAGRCSGGYHAFHASVANPRAAGVVVINSYAFVWDESQSVEEALKKVSRPLGDYSKRAMNPETFRRLLRGEVNLKAAGLAILRLVVAKTYNRIEPALGNLSAGNRLKSEIHAAFKALADRGAPVVLAYGRHDPGIEQARMVFGGDLTGLKRYPNTRFVSLGDSDHNVTVPEAQRIVIEEIARVAVEAGAKG